MVKPISRENAQNVQAWEAPMVADPESGNSGQSGVRNPNLLTAEQVEQVQKQAYEEAYEVGYQEGIQAGKEDLKASLQHFSQLMQSLQTPFAEMDEQVNEEILGLVMGMVKQLIRRELKSDPRQVMAVVREAIGALPVSNRSIQLHMHPEDAALVQEIYSLSGDEQTWKIIDDPVITRGGCKVITDTTQVDATLEMRIAQLFAKVFGGERQDDKAGPSGS